MTINVSAKIKIANYLNLSLPHFPLLIVFTAPTIIQSQMETLFSVQVATQTRLTCEAIFDPTAAITYSWTKDGQSLALNGHVHFLNAGQDGTIVIEMVEYGDAGVYQCTVETVYNGLAAPEVRSMDTTVTVTGNYGTHYSLAIYNSYMQAGR